MFEKMRRKDREISKEEAYSLLNEGEYAVLSTIGEDGYPYGVPVSYAYENNRIWIHGARTGHKISNLTFHNLVSLCVVGHTKVIGEKFTTEYESVIVSGKATLCENKEEKMIGLMALVRKYAPDFLESGQAYAKRSEMATVVYSIEIERISGKRRK
ncbi:MULTISPECIES: pyridoxamine 5'-phosphate oxidase family protein [Terrabacteria group]|uniref:pyridoxamine 5'-phosphate oxidase family protein n=1 Tax=Bacillati TaxID=1783272 RepID=UPI001939D840|nr:MULTISPECIES: pyridoxamine 5'-phosphate oxidase family protein [Terrabacteria group]MBW9211817.1 pyridoxamine 5'-phosphate oxidase family protein [Trueperella sp. zg.1013]QRG87378.1 pyridoxamine 5'-phosphate oxidase family protein [Bulleidia sp. zg-1006]